MIMKAPDPKIVVSIHRLGSAIMSLSKTLHFYIASVCSAVNGSPRETLALYSREILQSRSFICHGNQAADSTGARLKGAMSWWG